MRLAVSGHKNTAHSAPNSPLVRPAQPSRLWFGLPVATSQASDDNRTAVERAVDDAWERFVP